VALALLAGAVVALANLYAVASRSNDLSRAGTIAAILASQKLEQLRGLAWGYRSDGRELTDTTTDVAAHPNGSTGGTGLLPSPPGSLLANVPGFVDYLDRAGAWVGTGVTPPANAAYVRRWSIGLPPGSAGDAIVIHVVVLRRGGEARVAAGLGTHFETALLTGVLARRAP